MLSSDEHDRADAFYESPAEIDSSTVGQIPSEEMKSIPGLMKPKTSSAKSSTTSTRPKESFTPNFRGVVPLISFRSMRKNLFGCDDSKKPKKTPPPQPFGVLYEDVQRYADHQEGDRSYSDHSQGRRNIWRKFATKS